MIEVSVVALGSVPRMLAATRPLRSITTVLGTEFGVSVPSKRSRLSPLGS